MLEIHKGEDEIEEAYKTVFQEALKFIPVIKKTRGAILERTVPYDFRTGRIKGKFVLARILTNNEKLRLLASYENRNAALKIEGISLKEYLNVAALCYRACFTDKAEELSPEQMYRKWADGRDNGMLSIKDAESRRKFNEWLHHEAHGGGHPFEIVFSWHRHGIHLYPPTRDRPEYALQVTDYTYAEAFVRMAEALAKNNVAFVASDFSQILNHLAGETFFTVNDHGENSIRYFANQEDKKTYFSHIEWDIAKGISI